MIAGICAGTRTAQAAPLRADFIGEVTELTLDNAADPWSGGTIVVRGERIILPRNLILDYPANRLSLTDTFAQAPAECRTLHESGLARTDVCRHGEPGVIVTALANRMNNGNSIAGEVHFAKGNELITGLVTFINFNEGWFRVNGTLGSATAGMMVRLNDPPGRHSVQVGAGCLAASPNCSPDVRFTEDTDNYTQIFVQGYPACIPSTVATALRTVPAGATGLGDAFCPSTNRNGTGFSADSTRFAPLQVGDTVTVTGNRETVAGVEFLSAWSMQVNVWLLTRDDPTQPSYMRMEDARWDVPGFDLSRIRMTLTGHSTLTTLAIDFFGVHHDLSLNAAHEMVVASTVNNKAAVGVGVPTGFRLPYDVVFAKPPNVGKDPCLNLANASLTHPACPGTGIAGSFSVLSPVARDLVGRMRHTVNPGVSVRDMSGNDAPFGQYVTPVGFDFPAFIEIDPARMTTPYIFEGLPWLADRRLSPGGCPTGRCEATPQPLDPFPFSGLDPRAQVPLPVPGQVLGIFPFTGSHVAFPQLEPAVRNLAPVNPLPALCGGVLPAPTLTSVLPNSAPAGTSLAVSLVGTGFQAGATCSFGAGILSACTVISATNASGLIIIGGAATPGLRTVTLTNPDTQVATLANAFTVLPPLVVPTATLSASVNPLAVGSSSLLSWTTTNATSVTIAPLGAQATVNGSVSVSPATTTTYLLTAVGPGGTTTASMTLSVNPAAAAPPTATLTAVPAQIATGASSVLTFTTTNATTVNLDPVGLMATPSGSVTVSPTATTTYTLTASGPGGFASTALTVTVGGGVAAPTASLFALPSSVPAGSSTVLNFTSTGGATATIAPGVGAVPLSGTVTVTPATTTTYTYLVTGPGGLGSASTTVTVTGGTVAPLFTDNFNTVGNLSAGWSIMSGGFKTDGAMAVGQNNFNEARVVGHDILDAKVEALLTAGPTGNTGVRMRIDPAQPRFISYAAYIGSPGDVTITRKLAGVETTLTKVATALNPAIPHLLSATISGTSPVVITVTVDGVGVLSFTDASAQAIKAPGAVGLAGRTAGKYDTFTLTPP